MNGLKRRRSSNTIQVEYLESIDSTNDYLLRKASRGCNTPFACLAETQTKGKGRNGRTWFSPPGSNLYLSLLWHFGKEPKALSALGLVVALCVAQTLEQTGIEKPLGIKWPNDLFSEGKKLGGILIESLPYQAGHTSSVIGIGLNIYPFGAADHQITQPWTTVQALSSVPIDRTALGERLLENLVDTLECFEVQGFEAFYDSWSAYDLSLNQPLSLSGPQSSIQGIGRGVNREGLLILESPSGALTHYASGELSLRLDKPKGAYAPFEL